MLRSVLRSARRLDQLAQFSQLSRQTGVLFVEFFSLSCQLGFELRSATSNPLEFLGKFVPLPAKHLDFA